MEPVGLAAGVIALPVSLIQKTEHLIEYTQHLEPATALIVELRDVLKAISNNLLLMRDLVERQATEDADPTLLSALVSQSGILAEELDTSRSLLLKSGKGSSAAFRFKWTLRTPKLKASIERLKLSRSALHLLLQYQSLLLPIKSRSALHSLLQDQSLLLSIKETSTPKRTLVEPSIIAQWLDPSSHDSDLEHYKRTYHSGSGAWLFREPSFNRWKENPGKLLWCSGSPGVGKTFICSRIIEFLSNTFPAAKVPVLFFFIRYRDASTQTPTNVLRSLLAQLVRQTEYIPVALHDLYRECVDKTQLPLDSLWSILSSFIASFDRVFIVLDALDEYVQGPGGFLADFQQLFELPMTSVLVTSRPRLVNKTSLGDFDELEIRAENVTIYEYILDKFEKSWIHHPRNYEVSRDEVVATIVKQSDGNFLIARLLLDEVLHQPTIESMRRALSTDRSLSMLYDSMMDRIKASSAQLSRCAMEALSWLGFALGTFTVNQLLEAIAIQIGSDDLDLDDLPSIEDINQACAGLIVIEPSRQYVSLKHYSLVEYLRGYLTNVTHLLPGAEEPETFIAKKCLTCLRFRPFSLMAPSDLAELDDRLKKYCMLQYAARYWGEHAQRVPIENILDDVISLFALGNNTAAAGLVISISEKHPGHYEQAYRGMIGLHISAYFGLTKIVEHLVTNQRIDTDIGTVGAWTALHWAARRGWESTVSALLQHGASTSLTTKLDGWNALHLAAIEGHVNIVALLIKAKVDLNARDVQLRTALYLSTWAGFSEIAKELLDNGADPSLPNAYGTTALHCAAKRGRASIVSHLLAAGANVNAEDAVGSTALDEATRKQNSIIIQALVDAGAVPKKSNDSSLAGYMIGDFDWETYIVNGPDTSRIQNGSQCVCHVLERSSHGEHTNSNLKIFRKTYTLSKDIDGKMSKYFQSERRILERLRHPNVVAYLDFDEDPDQNAFILYTEFCNLGDIYTRYGRSQDGDNDDDEDSYYGFQPETATADSAEREPLPVQDFWMLVAQLASALTYLHYGLVVKELGGCWTSSFERTWIKVLHRDIKPANVVMQRLETNKCIFKLCDLGIASEVGRGAGLTRLIGTPGFRPPEVMHGKPWTTKGDIWAFGETIRRINKLKDISCEHRIKALIDKCENKIPKSRPNSFDIMEEAYGMLKANDMLAALPTLSRLQIDATHTLLGGSDGGYTLKAFNLVAELLDDIVPFQDEKSKAHRKATIQRLGHLWKDGAETRFIKYPNEFSLHTLILLDLPNPDRMKLFEKVVHNQPNVNKQWRQSRWTPLHLAAQAGNLEVVQRLLALGANPARLDLHGHAPAFYVNSANAEISSLLKTNAANDDAQESYAQGSFEELWGYYRNVDTVPWERMF